MAEQDFNINIRTTADTAGAKQTEAELARIQATAEQTAAAAGANIGRLIAPFVSGFSAFKFIDQLNVVAERLKQTSEELAKQGEQITENALKYQELAKGARDEGDVIKIASAALRDVEAAHKRVASAQQEELVWWDKITDSVYHALINTLQYGQAEQDAGRIAKQVLDLKIAGQQQLADMARQDLVNAIRSSELQKAAFEKLKAQPLDKSIAETNAKLHEQEEILKSIDYTKFPESWLAASKNVERTKDDLQEITKLHDKDVSQTAKDIQGAPANVQAILKNEQAAQIAQMQGNLRDQRMFQETADALKRAASPEQLEQARKFEGNPDIVAAINRLAELWK